MQHELAVVERALEIGPELKTIHDGLVGGGLVHLAAALAVTLRDVHGDVGVAEQLLGGRLAFLAVRVRHADARADVQLVPVDAERFLERAHDPSGDLDGADVG